VLNNCHLLEEDCARHLMQYRNKMLLGFPCFQLTYPEDGRVACGCAGSRSYWSYNCH